MTDNEQIQNTELGWDSGISAEAKEQNLPPEGTYGFTVVELERTYSKASGKPMAKINLELDKEGQYWHVYDNLVLASNMEWKLIAFFESVGLKKKGEALTKMPWDKVLGSTGRVTIKHEDYNGKTNCKVDRYVTSEAAKAPAKPDMSDVPFEV